MSDNQVGQMAWMDLTVMNAVEVKDFYKNIIGWKAESVSMGDYDDFSMHLPSNNEAVTGICHAKNINKDMPAAWLPYFLVANVDESVSEVTNLGGKLLTKIKNMGNDRYVVIQDPSGAVCALYQKEC